MTGVSATASCGPVDPPAQHVGLVVPGQVAEAQPHQEPVELRLGQLVGALVLDRVVGREHHERLRQPPRLAVDADLALAHRLEQRGLGLRRRAVDLVGQQQLGEDRAGAEHHLPVALVVQRRADHVRRQQVGGELDAGEVEAEHARERPRDQRLAQAGQVLEEHVAAGQDADQHQLEGAAAADHGLVELVEDRGGLPRGLFRSHSCSNRVIRRASVWRGMPRRCLDRCVGVEGLPRVDPGPEGFVGAGAAERPAGRLRLGVEVDAVALGQPGGEDVLENRAQVRLVQRAAGQAGGDDEPALAVAEDRPRLLLVLGPARRLGGRPGEGGAQHQQGEHGGGGGDHDHARPAGHGGAGQRGDGDQDRGDDQLGGRRRASGSRRRPRAVRRRSAVAALGCSSCRAAASSAASSSSAALAAARWRRRPGGWRTGPRRTARSACWRRGRGRSRPRPPGPAARPGCRRRRAAGAPVGQAALHRHVAGDDRGPGVADLGQRGPPGLDRLPQFLGSRVLDDQRRGRAAEPGGPPDADHHRRHQRDHQQPVEDRAPRDVQRQPPPAAGGSGRLLRRGPWPAAASAACPWSGSAGAGR